MNSPSFGKHGPEGERESGHQNPGPGCADHGEALLVRQPRVQSEQDDRGVSKNTSNDDQIIEVRRRHFYVSASMKKPSVEQGERVVIL